MSLRAPAAPAHQRRAGAIATAFAFSIVLVVASCGYTPVVVDRPPSQRFCIVESPAAAADAAASAALEAGVRTVLSRAGALGSCEQARRVRVALQGISSATEGILSIDGRPQARGLRVVATASAQVADDQAPWEIEGEVVIGTSSDRSTEAQVQADGRALAARRAGERIGHRLLGQSAAGTNPGP
ncbi:MAG: hypothetical protein HY898_13370 [Deltaproteobacteria bacterium]|nr:hypothetical protein [Deltaproteobacteria bacterium]